VAWIAKLVKASPMMLDQHILVKRREQIDERSTSTQQQISSRVYTYREGQKKTGAKTMRDKLPPDVTFAGDGEPSWNQKLDGDADGWQFVLGVMGGALHPKKNNRDGVDLLCYAPLEDLRVDPNFRPVMEAMRGWRCVQQRRPVRDDYQLIANGNDHNHFVCSLAPGEYRIKRNDDDQIQLFWRDIVGTSVTDVACHEPETQAAMAAAAKVTVRKSPPRRPVNEPAIKPKLTRRPLAVPSAGRKADAA
jgi:hypothetical protein